MRQAIAILFGICFANPAAASVKLGCHTDRVQQRPGVPAVWIVTFDETAKTASVSAEELGGLMNGTDVTIDSTLIVFKFTASGGRQASAALERGTGTMMVTVDGTGIAKVLAKCRKLSNAF